MLNIVCKGYNNTVEKISPHVLSPMRGLKMILSEDSLCFDIIELELTVFIILNCVKKQITI